MAFDSSRYYIFTSSAGATVQVLRGVDAPTLLSGGGRYSLIERPRRKSVVQWDGLDPYRMSVPVMFDGWKSSTSVESDIAKLNQMMQGPAEFQAPPIVKIQGSVPVKNAQWVIETIDWGQSYVIWKGTNRIRQDAVVNLLQYVPDTVVSTTRQPSANEPYRIKAGDTLRGLATKRGLKLSDIKRVNNIRDPKAIKVGQVILIPPAVFPTLNQIAQGGG